MSDGAAAIDLRCLGIVTRRGQRDVDSVLEPIRRFADERGIDIVTDGERGFDDVPLDLLLSLGGDGTLLRSARLVHGRGVPVLGVNLGHLGFLTSTGPEGIEEALRRITEGDYMLDRRFTLRARVVASDGRVSGRFHALNDFVVHKAGMARVTRLDLLVGSEEGEDGAPLDRDVADEIGSFSADGVVFATPTGSTAYSLSAGGPIIVPSVECIVVTPISPHTLAVRPLVVPATQRILIRGLDRPRDLVLTVDGQEGQTIGPDEDVVVERSPVDIPLVRFPGQTFFQTLRRKLHWAVETGGHRG